MTRKVRYGNVWVDLGADCFSYAPPDDPAVHPINATYGDELDTVPLDGDWTKRNIAEAEYLIPSPPPGVAITLDASGDGIWRAAPSGDFEIVVSLVGGWSPSQAVIMAGPAIIDSSGNGIGTSHYPDTGGSIWNWTLTSYAYAGSGNNQTGLGNPVSEYWLALRKTGTNYTARYSSNGTSWSAFTTAYNNAFTVNRIGVARFYGSGGPSIVEVKRFNVYPGPTFYVP